MNQPIYIVNVFQVQIHALSIQLQNADTIFKCGVGWLNVPGLQKSFLCGTCLAWPDPIFAQGFQHKRPTRKGSGQVYRVYLVLTHTNVSINPVILQLCVLKVCSSFMVACAFKSSLVQEIVLILAHAIFYFKIGSSIRQFGTQSKFCLFIYTINSIDRFL